MEIKTVTTQDYATLFDTSYEDIVAKCGDLISQYELYYSEVHNKDELILQILKRITQDRQKIAAPEREKVWQDGWQENLTALKSSLGNPESLIPKFIRNSDYTRWKKRYIHISYNPDFEYKIYTIYRQWMFKTYFSDMEKVYEFGAGTGFNLMALHSLFPDAYLCGSDFVDSSVDILEALSTYGYQNIHGYKFDMLRPHDNHVGIYPESGVFTVGSIEQLGGKFQDFIYYLIDQKPRIVVHTEPDADFYDLDCVEDYLAYMFQTKRGYSSGLRRFLQQLHDKGVVRLEKAKRLYFGNLYMEGYNLMVWRPL